MAALVAAIHAFLAAGVAWMAGTRRQVYAVCASLTAMAGHDGGEMVRREIDLVGVVARARAARAARSLSEIAAHWCPSYGSG